MNLDLDGRVAYLAGPAGGALDACAAALKAEGVQINKTDATVADIVVAQAQPRPSIDLLSLEGPQDLYTAWDDVLAAVTGYRAAIEHMSRAGRGRLIFIGSAQAKSVNSQADELAAIVSLGVLGLHKVVTAEVGPQNITANAVLRGGSATDEDIANAVTFLASAGAGYLSGVAITVDGGAGSGVF
jgi:NAD(P)-dependent dehydrogenase (short-subunit alcohol dehydrogenase family)